ncbi:MAG: hypoxanthine phosphoribosyltransferase [Actinobacteria bacterium]|nr:hypoxanthine phosphoribosyltransferase [Actinomycetota bacterium]MBU4240061.1 hypoxanthine phosphoribosyltransferase [Actinomycetota bacterium]MBU4301671.1 hypoxanthine phosphoribosyltransferase [Actinomycetota bacterium]MBU4489887.1 hypoxanthine phosphoribosyltransferase [Actinomycetota bacterium]MCG2795064.1 hypoxanthine phosphoribosyltransferase [Actinomycetes bacterium]
MAEPEIEGTLFTEEQVKVQVSELARRISEDYEDGQPLLVGILKGAFVFLADLARAMEIPVEFDFMALSSYGSMTKTSGVVRILKDLDTDITGRNVLIVEDLIDTGLTLNYLLRNIEARGPKSVEICALLNKRAANKVEIPIKYEGFSIPDVFVVGYGMDYAERYRNLPYIAGLKKQP